MQKGNSILNWFFEAELVLLAFSIPIYQKLIPYIIAAMVITWLVEADFITKARQLIEVRHRFHTLLFSVIYLLYGFGLLYSENYNYGYFDMEVKMSLFVFPIVISTMRHEVLSATIARRVL